MLHNQWLAVAMTTLLAVMQPQLARGQSPQYRNITLAEFSHWLEEKDFILINVHVPYQGEIPGTDLLLPYHSVKRKKELLPAVKDAKMVVYCLSGPMGYAAAESLVQLGYTRVYHYEGGMLDWVRNGRKLLYRRDK